MKRDRSRLIHALAKLRRGEPLSIAAINELGDLLDALRAEGWSGAISADHAIRVLAAANTRGPVIRTYERELRARQAIDDALEFCDQQPLGPDAIRERLEDILRAGLER